MAATNIRMHALRTLQKHWLQLCLLIGILNVLGILRASLVPRYYNRDSQLHGLSNDAQVPFTSFLRFSKSNRSKKLIQQQYYRQNCTHLQMNHAVIQDANGGMALYTKTTTTNPTFNISLHSADVDHVRWCIMRYGFYYEKFITQDFQDILKDYKKPSLVIDVGMNIGWFSLWARRLGHYTISFEPNPINRMRLCESLQLNNWTEDEIQVYPYGLGEKEEQVNFVMSRAGNPGAGRVKKEEDTEEPVLVNIITLDDFAESQGWLNSSNKVDPIPILKVDVEGHDPQVLRGANRLIRSGLIHNVLMEYSCTLSERQDMDGMVMQLLNAGFRLFKVGQWNGAVIQGAKEAITPQEDKPVSPTMAEQLYQYCINRQLEGHSAQLNLWWKAN